LSTVGIVYCNLCPLKERCPYAEPDQAYFWSRMKYAKDREEQDRFFAQCDYGRLQMATNNCPLKKVMGNN